MTTLRLASPEFAIDCSFAWTRSSWYLSQLPLNQSSSWREQQLSWVQSKSLYGLSGRCEHEHAM